MRTIAVVLALAMAGCSSKADEPASEVAPPPEPGPPTLADDDRHRIASYASGAIITCGTVVAVQSLRQMGRAVEEPPSPAYPADDVMSMHAALADFPSAQQALKDLRTAETLCDRTGSPSAEAAVRTASVALRTELEMIPGS